LARAVAGEVSLEPSELERIVIKSFLLAMLWQLPVVFLLSLAGSIEISGRPFYHPLRGLVVGIQLAALILFATMAWPHWRAFFLGLKG
jgi:hypothetical protein